MGRESQSLREGGSWFLGLRGGGNTQGAVVETLRGSRPPFERLGSERLRQQCVVQCHHQCGLHVRLSQAIALFPIQEFCLEKNYTAIP